MTPKEYAAMIDTVIGLAKDRGMENPMIRHEIDLKPRVEGGGTVKLFCLEDKDEKRDWIVGLGR